MRFVGERVAHVERGESGGPAKKPHAPIAFVWRGTRVRVQRVVSEWRTYGDEERPRPGSDAGRPPYAIRSRRKNGSWGVGRHWFRVLTTHGQLFDIYYDRRPEPGHRRLGSWWVYAELTPSEAGLEPEHPPGRRGTRHR